MKCRVSLYTSYTINNNSSEQSELRWFDGLLYTRIFLMVFLIYSCINNLFYVRCTDINVLYFVWSD